MKQQSLKIFLKEETGPYELPKGWRWVRLGEVCKINKNSRNPAKEIPDKEFLYIDITSVEGGTGEIKEIKKILGENAPSRARRVIHQDDVIMSTVRPYLKAFAVIPPEYDNQICSTGFAVLSCNSEILPKFLLYALFSEVVIEQCNKMMIGAHYPALNNEQVSEIKIPLPPLPEQKRIVARIEALFSKINEIKRLRKEANDLAKTLPQSTLHEVFSKADEKGWRWVRLGEVLSRKPQYGLTAKASKETLNIRYLRISDITDQGILKNNDPRFLDLNEQEFNKYRLYEGDILIARSGSVGRVYLHHDCEQKVVFASYLIRFKLDTNQIIPKFFFYYGLSPLYKKYIEDTLRIVAQPNINATEYSNLQIPLPPLSEQKRIITYLDNIQQKAQALQRLQEETEKEVEKVREAILHKAFRGEL